MIIFSDLGFNSSLRHQF